MFMQFSKPLCHWLSLIRADAAAANISDVSAARFDHAPSRCPQSGIDANNTNRRLHGEAQIVSRPNEMRNTSLQKHAF
jgi:hypothetical protein